MKQNSSEIIKLNEISEKVQENLTEAVKEIFISLENTKKTLEEYQIIKDKTKSISVEISNIEKEATESTNSVETISKAADNLNSLTAGLNSLLSLFKTKGI